MNTRTILRIFVSLACIAMGLCIAVFGTAVGWGFRHNFGDCLDPLGLGVTTILLGITGLYDGRIANESPEPSPFRRVCNTLSVLIVLFGVLAILVYGLAYEYLHVTWEFHVAVVMVLVSYIGLIAFGLYRAYLLAPDVPQPPHAS